MPADTAAAPPPTDGRDLADRLRAAAATVDDPAVAEWLRRLADGDGAEGET